MHQSLHHRDLSKLPSNLCRRAIAAAQGSIGDLLFLSLPITSGKPASDCEFLLPIFYAGLDATPVPGLASRLDSLSPNDAVALSRAIVSLEAVSHLVSTHIVSRGAFVNLWPRCWEWIHLLDMYWDSLPHIESDMSRCYASFAILIVGMGRGEASNAFPAKSGVRTVLVPLGLPGISILGYFQEAIDGSSGTHMDLAALVVEHIKRVAAHKDKEFRGGGLFCIMHLNFLTYGTDVDYEFQEALIHHGIVKAVTLAVCVLSCDGEAFLHPFLQKFIQYFSCPPGSHSIVVSLRAGLLPALVACAQKQQDDLNFLLRRLLDVLSRSLVYRKVLTRLRAALVDLGDGVTVLLGSQVSK
ncbi:hypothetical protein DFH07DRAFT_951591 [Mycena maculata]|uniref:Uncharacterized protein n=1 Tax=Mycena maculata TaxID=230809 RepID=A0AAD7NVM2_9AGAR|nr:hypothetical protein DFH07DRAFT_951591 [Mycena maculata]